VTTAVGTAPPVDTIWFSRCPVPTALGIAAQRGWLAAAFASCDIAVRSLQSASSAPIPDGHFTHAVPGLIREGGNVPALWARSTGSPTRLIGLSWIEERQAIIVRRDHDVHGSEWLAGLRIAVPRRRGTAIDFWRAMALSGFSGALRSQGLSLNDAAHVDVDASVDAPEWEPELQALRDGRVDAVYVKGAQGVEAAEEVDAMCGLDLDTLPDRRFRVNNGTPRPLTVHQQLLDERPDLFARFLSVLVAVPAWAESNAEELTRALGAETGAGTRAVGTAYVRPNFRLSLSGDHIDLLAQQEQFLWEQGILPARVDIATWIDAEPLKAAQSLLAERITRP